MEDTDITLLLIIQKKQTLTPSEIALIVIPEKPGLEADALMVRAWNAKLLPKSAKIFVDVAKYVIKNSPKL